MGYKAFCRCIEPHGALQAAPLQRVARRSIGLETADPLFDTSAHTVLLSPLYGSVGYVLIGPQQVGFVVQPRTFGRRLRQRASLNPTQLLIDAVEAERAWGLGRAETSESVLALRMCVFAWCEVAVTQFINSTSVSDLCANACLTAAGAIETDMALSLMAQADDATVAMVKTFMVRCCGPYPHVLTRTRVSTIRDASIRTQS